GVVGSPLVLSGSGFPAASEVELAYTANRGNRLSGTGWEVVEVPLGSVTTDAAGAFTFELATPDDLGGEHDLVARAREGDVTIHLRAPGQPGWHFVSLYPAIY